MARPGRLGVGIIGAGKVGAVLGAALRAAEHAVVGVSAVSEASRERAETLLPGVPILEIQEIVERSELVLLAVPDDSLGELVNGLAALGAWQPGQLVAHTSGRFGVGILNPVRVAGADSVGAAPRNDVHRDELGPDPADGLHVRRDGRCRHVADRPSLGCGNGSRTGSHRGGRPDAVPCSLGAQLQPHGHLGGAGIAAAAGDRRRRPGVHAGSTAARHAGERPGFRRSPP